MNAMNHHFNSAVSPVALAHGWAVISGGKTAAEFKDNDFPECRPGDVEAMAVEFADKIERRTGENAEAVKIAAEPEAPAESVEPPAAIGNFAIARDSIGKVMEALSRVVEKRNFVPILSNVLLQASGGILVATATDLDKQVSAMVECGAGEFTATLPAHKLKDIFKKAAASFEVGFRASADGQSVNVFWGKLSYTLPALHPDDFPSLTMGALSHRFELSGEAFRTMLESTARAMSKEETRYYLNGIFVHTINRGNRVDLLTVATDGHRLYRCDLESPAGAEGMSGIIVPRGTVELFLALTKGKGACPATVSIEAGETHVRLSFDGIEIASKLIDGTFPDYQRVVPTGNDKVASFKAAEFMEALESVSLVMSERGRAVRLTIDANHAVMNVCNPEGEAATMEFAATLAKAGEAAPEIEIGFNASYLATLMKDLADDGGEIMAEFANPGDPAVFRSGRADFMAVLMPMRV